jgi:membrane protease YdiL (CAAX protease family)
MAHLPDHLIFLLLAVVLPLRAMMFGFGRLRRADAAQVPRVRMWLYRQIMIIQWSLAALVALIWGRFGRPWVTVGLVPRDTWAFRVATAAVVIAGVVLVVRGRGARDDPETLEKLRRRFERIERMLPHDVRELRWFSAVGITAGICEEFLYRGYLLWYLGRFLPVGFAVGASALIFGLGHSYQGPRGVLVTAVVGAVMAGLYIVTGSLYAPMMLHALMDLYSGWVTWRAFRAAPEPAPTSPPAGAMADP